MSSSDDEEDESPEQKSELRTLKRHKITGRFFFVNIESDAHSFYTFHFSVKRNEFEKRRKMHYNEFDAVRRARQLIEEEDDDDSEGECSRTTQCNNYQDSNLDDNTMDVDDNNKQSTSSALDH